MMPYTRTIGLAALAGLGLAAAPAALAADLGYVPPEPIVEESWTGFYVGGGGIGFFSTDVSSSSSCTDEIGFCRVKDGKKGCEREKKKDKKFAPFATLL